MGNRFYMDRKPTWDYMAWVWSYKSGHGRWCKRRLSKARRRYAKQMIRFGRGKEPTGIESYVNYKGT